MGAGNTILKHPFSLIGSFSWSRCKSIISSYYDGEYDFGIDYTVVMNITGLGIDDAKALVKSHSNNDSGIINSLTLLVTIITLSDSNQRNEEIRLREIFSLFDFNKVGEISCDELTLLLTTLHSSYGFILNSNLVNVNVPLMVKSTEYIYKFISKQLSGPINVNDLCLYCTEKLFNEGVFTIDGINSCLLNGLSDDIKE